MLSIGSFSKLAHISAKALRYYDEIGLLKPRQVDGETGYRYYDVSQLESILLIGRLKSYGFTLDEIARVLKNPGDNRELLPVMEQKKRDVQGMLANYAVILKQLNGDMANLERGNHIMSYLDHIAVKLTETKPQNILYIREKMDVQQTGRYIHSLQERVSEQKLTPVAPPMAIFHGEEFDPESYDMELAIPVKEAVDGTRQLPALLCARATLKGDYSGLPSVYAKIREWIEKEGYETAAPGFEVYVTDPAQTPPDETITEVYFPIKKRI